MTAHLPRWPPVLRPTVPRYVRRSGPSYFLLGGLVHWSSQRPSQSGLALPQSPSRLLEPRRGGCRLPLPQTHLVRPGSGLLRKRLSSAASDVPRVSDRGAERIDRHCPIGRPSSTTAHPGASNLCLLLHHNAATRPSTPAGRTICAAGRGPGTMSSRP